MRSTSSDTAVVMPSPTPAAPTEKSPSLCHLTVHPEGLGPGEVHFSFEHQEKRMGNSLVISVVSHAAFVAMIFLIASLLPDRVVTAMLPDRLPDQIVWLAE